MAKTKQLIKSSKYKVGDYITGPDKVFLKIVGVVDSAVGCMYAMKSPKSERLNWASQYELDGDDMTVATPDFEAFNKIQEGDIVRVWTQGKDELYVTILARVGDAVLTSKVPNKRLADMLVRMDKAMKDISEDTGLGIEDLMDEETMQEFKRVGSQLHSSKVVGEWFSVDTMALMNWEVVKE